MIVKNGIIEGIEYLPSPNFDNRPDESSIDLIVVHAISLPPKNYDTQTIKTNYLEHAHHGDQEWLDKSAIHGALNLYLDFLNMFSFLLMFMGSSE